MGAGNGLARARVRLSSGESTRTLRKQEALRPAAAPRCQQGGGSSRRTETPTADPGGIAARAALHLPRHPRDPKPGPAPGTPFGRRGSRSRAGSRPPPQPKLQDARDPATSADPAQGTGHSLPSPKWRPRGGRGEREEETPQARNTPSGCRENRLRAPCAPRRGSPSEVAALAAGLGVGRGQGPPGAKRPRAGPERPGLAGPGWRTRGDPARRGPEG